MVSESMPRPSSMSSGLVWCGNGKGSIEGYVVAFGVLVGAAAELGEVPYEVFELAAYWAGGYVHAGWAYAGNVRNLNGSLSSRGCVIDLCWDEQQAVHKQPGFDAAAHVHDGVAVQLDLIERFA